MDWNLSFKSSKTLLKARQSRGLIRHSTVPPYSQTQFYFCIHAGYLRLLAQAEEHCACLGVFSSHLPSFAAILWSASAKVRLYIWLYRERMSLESYPLAPLHKQDNVDKIHSYHLPLYQWHTITTVSDNGTEAIKAMVLFMWLISQ